MRHCPRAIERPPGKWLAVMSWRPRHQLSAQMTDVIAATLPDWPLLDDEERARVGHLAEGLLGRVSWEASRGFALDDVIRGTIAGHAALLGMGLPDPVFPNVRAVVVHPGTITMRGARAGPIPNTVDDQPLPVLGHTSARGPVSIAWDVLSEQAERPTRGQNVIFHELAHKLDAAEGSLDGTPQLQDPEQRRRWIQVCDAEYQLLRTGLGSPLLSDYAATNPSEFFAVATEVFMNRGPELAADREDLYAVMRDFYGQDPAARRRWSGGSSVAGLS